MTRIHREFSQLTNVEPVEFLDSGWPKLRHHYRPYQTALTVLTGTPGSGKTLFLLQHALHMAKIGKRTAFCLFENDSLDVHYFVENYCNAEGLDPNVIYDKYMRFIEIDDDTRPSLPWAKSMVERLQMEEDWSPDFFMIDPWNQIEGVQAKVSLEQQQKEALSDLKQFFRVRRCGLIIAAHPTKGVLNQDGGTRIVRAGDVSGSMHFWNAADYVLTLNRMRDVNTLEFMNTTCLVIDKVKKQGLRTGMNTGKVLLEWSEKTQQLIAGDWKL